MYHLYFVIYVFSKEMIKDSVLRSRNQKLFYYTILYTYLEFSLELFLFALKSLAWELFLIFFKISG